MRTPRVVMLLGNGFDPDPRVQAAADALAQAGCDVSVLCWDRDGNLPEREERGPVHVHRIRLLSTHGRGTSQLMNMPKVWREYVRLGESLRPDVVHAHDLDTLPAGWRLARRSGAALVFDAHESYPDMLGDNVAGWVKWGARRLEKFLLPRTDLVVASCERMRAHYAAMRPRDSAVVGNWRNPVGTAEEQAAIRQAVRVEAGVMPESVLICFIANLTPERMVEPLLEAVRRVPQAELVVGGRGPAAEAVKAAAAECPRIRYLGGVQTRDVMRWTAASDAVYYGFDPQNRMAWFSSPNKLFEALSAGIPVISASFGEIGEIVPPSGCGILVPEYTPGALEAALRELLRPERAAELREAARRAGRRYTRDAADESLRTAYGRMLAPRGIELAPVRGKAA